MSLSLYTAVIPTYLQILESMAGLIDKADAHCKSNDLAAKDLLQATLAEDMLPLAYQLNSTAWHSKMAIEGLRKGVFSPNRVPAPEDFAVLRSVIADARQSLQSLTAAEVDAFVGQPMRFEMGEMQMHFTAEEFLFSFSQPNFFFHATTAYDILRGKGLDIGKRDYLGKIRTL